MSSPRIIQQHLVHVKVKFWFTFLFCDAHSWVSVQNTPNIPQYFKQSHTSVGIWLQHFETERLSPVNEWMGKDWNSLEYWEKINEYHCCLWVTVSHPAQGENGCFEQSWLIIHQYIRPNCSQRWVSVSMAVFVFKLFKDLCYKLDKHLQLES